MATRFMVVRLMADGSTVPYPNGLTPQLYNSGADAEYVCTQLARLNGGKWQPRPVLDGDWEQRERDKFADGTYLHLPWHGQLWFKPIPGHYAHPSRKSPGYIAYTENPEKGAQDIRRVVPPGRYLREFYGKTLSTESIKVLATEFVTQHKPLKLKLARTEEEIIEVYLNGPRSCMSKHERDFASEVNPVSVYAGPDLAIGYVKTYRKIHARAICWPDKKLYGRIYGDKIRMQTAFMANGYKQGPMTGARLIKRKSEVHPRYYICPYIDGDKLVHVDGEYLVIGAAPKGSRNRSYDASRQDGLAAPFEFECGYCGGIYDRTEAVMFQDGDGDLWCPSCADDHAYVCVPSGRRYMCLDSMVRLYNGILWSWDHYHNGYGFQCQDCRRRFPIEMRKRHYDKQRGNRYVCPDCESIAIGQLNLQLAVNSAP